MALTQPGPIDGDSNDVRNPHSATDVHEQGTVRRAGVFVATMPMPMSSSSEVTPVAVQAHAAETDEGDLRGYLESLGLRVQLATERNLPEVPQEYFYGLFLAEGDPNPDATRKSLEGARDMFSRFLLEYPSVEEPHLDDPDTRNAWRYEMHQRFPHQSQTLLDLDRLRGQKHFSIFSYLTTMAQQAARAGNVKLATYLYQKHDSLTARPYRDMDLDERWEFVGRMDVVLTEGLTLIAARDSSSIHLDIPEVPFNPGDRDLTSFLGMYGCEVKDTGDTRDLPPSEELDASIFVDHRSERHADPMPVLDRLRDYQSRWIMPVAGMDRNGRRTWRDSMEASFPGFAEWYNKHNAIGWNSMSPMRDFLLALADTATANEQPDVSALIASGLQDFPQSAEQYDERGEDYKMTCVQRLRDTIVQVFKAIDRRRLDISTLEALKNRLFTSKALDDGLIVELQPICERRGVSAELAAVLAEIESPIPWLKLYDFMVTMTDALVNDCERREVPTSAPAVPSPVV